MRSKTNSFQHISFPIGNSDSMHRVCVLAIRSFLIRVCFSVRFYVVSMRFHYNMHVIMQLNCQNTKLVLELSTVYVFLDSIIQNHT